MDGADGTDATRRGRATENDVSKGHRSGRRIAEVRSY